MKNTKFVKILSSALAVILLVCALTCISVLAENTDPTVEIKYKNLSYGGTISIAFAVKADDYEAVDLLVYESEPADPATEAADYTVTSYLEKSKIKGEELAVFLTPGIAPRYMNKQIYAVARLSTGDGYVYSDVVRYSITEYAYEVQYDETLVENYVTFGQTLISYGDQIKDLLGDTDSKPSDMSYVAIADGYEGTVDGKYSAGIFSSEDAITLSAYTGAAPDNQTYINRWFSNVEDEVTVDEGATATVTSNAVFSPLFVSSYAAGSYYGGDTEGTEYSFDTSDTTGLSGATVADGAVKFSGNGGHSIANNVQANFEIGSKYIFEADFTYVDGEITEGAKGNAAFIGLLSNSTTHNNQMLAYSYLELTDDSYAAKMFGYRFEKGVKYNIRIEYTVGDNSELPTGTSSANYTARSQYVNSNLAFYVNGVKQELTASEKITVGYANSTIADDKSFYGFGVYTRGTSYTTTLDLTFDNVYIGPKGETVEEKIDSYYETATTGTKYSFDTDDDTSAVVTKSNNTSGTGSVTAANGELTVADNPTWYAFAFKNADYDDSTTYANGTKYVFEADITYNGGANVSSTDLGAAFVGFFSSDNSPYKDGNMFNYMYAKYEDKGFNFCGAYFDVGDTKKITLEYTVGNKTVVDVYVEGVKTSSATFTDKSANSDSNFFGFGFYCRGTSYTNNLSLTFDNVYLGVVEAE